MTDQELIDGLNELANTNAKIGWTGKLKTWLTNLVNSKAQVGPKVYRALITQTSTDAPTAVVLENTIGEINWVYDDPGQYRGVSAGLFSGNLGGFSQNTNVSLNSVSKVSNDWILLRTFDSTGLATDGLLTNSLLEIIIYP